MDKVLPNYSTEMRKTLKETSVELRAISYKLRSISHEISNVQDTTLLQTCSLSIYLLSERIDKDIEDIIDGAIKELSDK